MGEVDTKNQQFESEMNIISRWLEPELDRKQAKVSNGEASLLQLLNYLQSVATAADLHNSTQQVILFRGHTSAPIL
jgi:hypothetical protein